MIKTVVLLALFLAGTTSTIVIENGQPKVVTSYGTVYGNVMTYETASAGNYYFFKGVPYAQPPVGNLRFEKPEPLQNFGVFNATEFGNICVQFRNPTLNGDEDCLNLNIAVPSTPGPHPVMVFIFGGAFTGGEANTQQTTTFHDRFVRKDIIYVSMNYRVGPLGYYTTGDSEAPGNYGSWDQLEAFKFIQEVISEFNGDPSKVTAFGTSSGGQALSYLTFSNHSDGLFQQAIPYCGNAHSIGANGNNTMKHSRQLETYTGCTGANRKDCLKGKPIADIWAGATIDYISDTIDNAFWFPRFDNDLFTADTFVDNLNDAPAITTLYGLNTNEEIAFAMNTGIGNANAQYYPVQQSYGPNFTETDFRTRLEILITERELYGNFTEEAAQTLIDFYATLGDNNPVGLKWLQAYVQFFSDVHFGMGLVREAKQKVAAGKTTYVYINDYRIPQYRFANPLLDGDSHCAENPYIFGNWTGLEPPSDDPDYGQYVQVVEDFVNMWVSFVKNGVPQTPSGPIPTVTTSNVKYAYISNTTTIQDNLWEDRSSVWESVATDYGFDWVTGFWQPL